MLNEFEALKSSFFSLYLILRVYFIDSTSQWENTLRLKETNEKRNAKIEEKKVPKNKRRMNRKRRTKTAHTVAILRRKKNRSETHSYSTCIHVQATTCGWATRKRDKEALWIRSNQFRNHTWTSKKNAFVCLKIDHAKVYISKFIHILDVYECIWR